MSTATVVRLPRRAAAPSERAVRKSSRLSRHQALAATGVGAVALVLTGLSLTHLSAGIQIVTNSSTWEAWSMAIGVDLGFVALELSQLCPLSDKTTRKIRSWARGAICGTLVGSALMNAFAFAAATSGWFMYPAAALGVAIPALIYAMTRVGATIWMERG